MVGMATIIEGYPLYTEATNEKGLSIAGLKFPGNACYLEAKENKKNVTPFELIPWILGTFTTVEEVKQLYRKRQLSIFRLTIKFH